MSMQKTQQIELYIVDAKQMQMTKIASKQNLAHV